MPKPDGDGRLQLESLERLLEHRIRLAICVLLSRNDALSFARLKDLLDETDGSLGAHLQKLEEGGYIHVRKEFQDRKPVSWYMLRPSGRKALLTHLATLERLIEQARTK
jgi:DNA-binding MarR family transcriptional regulator